MFRCHVIKELSGYLDNQLSDKRKMRIDKHLQECALCSKELSRLKILSGKLKTWQAPSLDADFDNSVRNEIVRRELEKGAVKMKKNTLFILVPSSVLAALLMFAFVGRFTLQRGLSGRYKASSDELGEQFDKSEIKKVAKTESGYNRLAESESISFSSDSYGGGGGGGSAGGRSANVREPGQGLTFSKSAAMENSNGIISNEVLAVPAVKASAAADELGEQFDKSEIKKVAEAKSGYRQLEESGSIGFESGESSGLEQYSSSIKATEMDVSPFVHTPPPKKAPYEFGNKQQERNIPVIVIQPALPATGIGEKIIRTGTIRMEVENGKETYSRISMMCQELNGFLASSNFYKDGEAREAGTITLRIPKEKFSLALDRLSAFGKVENINTASQDVSQEYANLQSQLDGVMIIYNKMLDALKKKQVTISEAVRLESELTPVLNRVQNLKNKIEYLNNAIALTTITVEFHEAKISIKALNESKRYIKESILAAQINAVRTLSKILPLIIGLAVLIVILAVMAVAVKNWIVHTFKRG